MGNSDFVDIDFLSSYYNQDGNNGAVTGGVGTEALTDVSTLFVVNVPLDSTRSINGTIGADYYTSASTDNIDDNRSSASSKDVRAYANFGFTKKYLKKGFTIGTRIGFSTEYDYTSFNGGFNLAKEFNYGNTEIGFSGQAFIDQWSLYFPSELRGSVDVDTKSRNSYNSQLSFSQVINRRLQFSLSAEAIYMKGLLSTPFHRVYFSDSNNHDIERLPNSRLKLPFSIRVNYYPFESLVLRSYYRFYTDDFGINAHTISIETPIKLSYSFSISPFYRYHKQSESDYFAAYEIHKSTDEFYTSDYDLSGLSTNKYGVGIMYNPAFGLTRTKIPFSKKLLLLNSIQLRGSYYERSTGLKGYSISLELNMKF